MTRMEWVERLISKWILSNPPVYRSTIDHAQSDIAKLIAAVKVADKALSAVQFSVWDYSDGTFRCPECGESRIDGHARLCKVGVALAQLQSGEFGEDGEWKVVEVCAE